LGWWRAAAGSVVAWHSADCAEAPAKVD
jgi:hypothetical protein